MRAIYKNDFMPTEHTKFAVDGDLPAAFRTEQHSIVSISGAEHRKQARDHYQSS